VASLRVIQVRSCSDKGRKQKGTIRALGLKRLGDSVTHQDTPEILGMLRAVEHLVTVEEIDR
jgi:large subunit ribosomal protein L30